MTQAVFPRMERRATRMHEMMERLDVDPLVLVRFWRGDAYAEARARCLFCGTSDKCLRWLEPRPPPDKRPEFCPNLSLFEACRRNPPHIELIERKAGPHRAKARGQRSTAVGAGIETSI